MYRRFVCALIGAIILLAIMPAPLEAQMAEMPMAVNPAGWQFMQDGTFYAIFNHQSGPRGGNELKVPNWWMGMATRKVGSSDLTFTSMLSLDPALVGKRGYREAFQVGEAVAGAPLVDRQHPHDLFMQLAVVWRVPITGATGFTVAGGPVGEPALGPVAFMHRASAADNPFAPLAHHTSDSTHIAFGVLTAAVDHGPWVFEGSVFNSREPDEARWDFDFGALDSVSGRLWFKPNDQWELQLSTGHLTHPEELEPGNIQRTTASAAWLMRDGANFSALTVGYGVNATDNGSRQAVFGEATMRRGRNSIFGRIETLQVETALLVTGRTSSTGSGPSQRNVVGAFTGGGVRDIIQWHRFEGGVGAMVTACAVPEPLKVTHGRHPVSFQVYFRLRVPAGPMGRMWNMRMAQPMSGDGMSMSHGMN